MQPVLEASSWGHSGNNPRGMPPWKDNVGIHGFWKVWYGVLWKVTQGREQQRENVDNGCRQMEKGSSLDPQPGYHPQSTFIRC